MAEPTDALTNLAHDYIREWLDYDILSGNLIWKKRKYRAPAGSIAGAKDGKGYLVIKLNQRCYRAHRLVWFWVKGTWPTLWLDHINGNKTDNRIENLREATIKQNGWNRTKSKQNTSGYKGVTKDKKKWAAQTIRSGKHIVFGYFNTPEEAYECYCRNMAKHDKEFYRG